MYGNFIAESCTGTTGNLTLTGAKSNHLAFSEKFVNTDSVAYVVEDADGVNKCGGIGTFNTGGTITRNDSWTWNGTTYNDAPGGNLTLSGGSHTVRVAPISSVMTDWDTAYAHSQTAHAPSNADNTALNETTYVSSDFIHNNLTGVSANEHIDWTTDAGGSLIAASNLPGLALTTVNTVANEAAQLALSAQQGDVAIRTDLNKSYVHNGGVAGTIADWSELLTPTDTLLSVTGSGPISSSGGANPDISISQANASTDGYLSSTDWNTFNNNATSSLSASAAENITGDWAFSKIHSTGTYLTIQTRGIRIQDPNTPFNYLGWVGSNDATGLGIYDGSGNKTFWANVSGAAELYDNIGVQTLRLTTTSTGVDVIGTLTRDSNTVYDSANFVAQTDYEDFLGNPVTDGFVLSSTALGVRSWVDVTDSTTFSGKSLTSSGDRWDVVPLTDISGETDIGRFLNFHTADNSTDNYDFSLQMVGTTNPDLQFRNDTGSVVMTLGHSTGITLTGGIEIPTSQKIKLNGAAGDYLEGSTAGNSISVYTNSIERFKVSDTNTDIVSGTLTRASNTVHDEGRFPTNTVLDNTVITDGYVLTWDDTNNYWYPAAVAAASEVNDLTASVTWANIPIANVPTGTTGSTVALGNHTHTGVYEPAFTKNTAFNDNYGTGAGTVCQGNDSRLSDNRSPTLTGNLLTAVPAGAVFTDTIYSLPQATATVRGGVELFSNTTNTVAGNAVSSTASRTYGIQLNSSNQMVVNVPWTNTVYTHPSYSATNQALSGASVVSTITTNSTGHVTALANRTLTAANIGAAALSGAAFTGTVTSSGYFQPEYGITGKYGVTGSASWGGTIYGMGASFKGTVSGASWAPTSLYGMGWVRSGNGSYRSNVGEGAYIYQNGIFKGGIGTTGLEVTGAITVGGLVDGRDVAADGSKLDGVATSANNYTHPSYSSTNINTSGATIVDIITTNSTGHVTALGTRTLTAADIGAATSSHTHTTITVADESTDTTCFPLFATAATGNTQPKTGTNLTFNSSSGLLTATTLNSTSDIREKDVLDFYLPVQKIEAIRYDWKNKKAGVNQYGYSAQDVEKVLPTAVETNQKTGIKSLNYNMVHTVKIAQLEQEVDELKHLVKQLLEEI